MMNSENSNELNSSPTSIANNDPPIRMKLINTAAEFLVSPSVQNSSMDLKLSFLQKKGLTDAEIEMAIKQSDARLLAIKENAASMQMQNHMQLTPMYYPMAPTSRWTMFRDVANSAILIGGFVYGAYWAYRAFVVPYFFGKKDKKSIETKLSELDHTMSSFVVEVSSGLGKLRDEIEKIGDRRTENIHKEINELKSEVTSLKKLLLNRKQFPTAAVMTPLSIPSWQITEGEEKQQTPEEEGNNSNGSESSLEMIKE